MAISSLVSVPALRIGPAGSWGCGGKGHTDQDQRPWACVSAPTLALCGASGQSRPFPQPQFLMCVQNKRLEMMIQDPFYMTLTSKSSGASSTALKFSSHRNPKAWLGAEEGRGKGSRPFAALFQALDTHPVVFSGRPEKGSEGRSEQRSLGTSKLS